MFEEKVLFSIYDTKLDRFYHSSTGKWLYQRKSWVLSRLDKLNWQNEKYLSGDPNRYELKEMMLTPIK